jgi:hypothetical protein
VRDNFNFFTTVLCSAKHHLNKIETFIPCYENLSLRVLYHMQQIKSIYTSNVMVSPKITFDKSDNQNWKVTANQTIKSGEILLVEHIVSGEKSICHKIIKNNDSIYRSLYPRAETGESNKSDNALKKLYLNSFANGQNAGNMDFGLSVAHFNHSCDNNAIVMNTSINFKLFDVKFITVISINQIGSGGEVMISYGTHVGHGPPPDKDIDESYNTIICRCPKSESVRMMRTHVVANLAKKLYDDAKKDVMQYIENYVMDVDFVSVLFNQYLACQGMFVDTDESVSYNDKFLDSLGVTKDNIDNDVISAYMKKTFDMICSSIAMDLNKSPNLNKS